MHFLDANIFLEIELGDEHARQCKEFLQAADQLFTSDFVVYSCLLKIWKSIGLQKHMKDFLIFINSLDIRIIRQSPKAMCEAVSIMERYKLDFDDALVVSCMKEYGIKNLVSYDQHFEKAKEITVIRP